LKKWISVVIPFLPVSFTIPQIGAFKNKPLLNFILPFNTRYETNMKNHLRTSVGMPSAKGMIIMRVQPDLNKKL
jgi:hypothetical protein